MKTNKKRSLDQGQGPKINVSLIKISGYVSCISLNNSIYMWKVRVARGIENYRVQNSVTQTMEIYFSLKGPFERYSKQLYNTRLNFQYNRIVYAYKI